MVPPARLNQLQMEQVRDIVAEEFNNGFNELIPGVTNDIINQFGALLDERCYCLCLFRIRHTTSRSSTSVALLFGMVNPTQLLLSPRCQMLRVPS